MTEERALAVSGVSGGTLSVTGVKRLEAKAMLECAAVARIALSRSILFCCLLGPSDPLVRLRFAMGGSDSSRWLGAAGSSSSALRFLLAFSEMEGSTIGQTNPVRGV